MRGQLQVAAEEDSVLPSCDYLAGRDAGEDKSYATSVLDTVGNASRSGKNNSRADWQIFLALTQENPLTFKHDPDMVTGVHVRMDVLAWFKAPECSAGMTAFCKNHFAGLFVTIADFVVIIAGLGVHFILQVV